MATDLDLLRDFFRHGSQEAFTALVRRNLPLVYSAALRQVRSHHLAEEVAQSVFIDLARMAEQLKPDTLLSSWLYTVTYRTAVDVIRTEVRRRALEQVATEMNPPQIRETTWQEIGTRFG